MQLRPEIRAFDPVKLRACKYKPSIMESDKMNIFTKLRTFLFGSKSQSSSLTTPIATRQNTLQWANYLFGILPDPDDFLRGIGKNETEYYQVLEDTHVFSCWINRISKTLGREWQINPNADDPMPDRATAIAEETDKMFRSINMRDLQTDILRSPLFGFQPIEIFWTKDYRIERTEGKPFEYFGFHATDNSPRFLSKNNMIDGDELPDKKFLIPRHFSTYRNPYGIKLLKLCYWHWFFRKNGFRFWNIFAEKYGMPMLHGKVPANTAIEDRTTLYNALVNAVQDSVIVTNDDESIELHEAGGSASADIFSKLLDRLDKEVTKAFAGQSMTSDLGSVGSQAAVETYSAMQDNIIQMDQQLIIEQMGKLIRWYVELNYGADIPCPEFAFYEESDIQKPKADRDKVLFDMGCQFTSEYFLREYGFMDGDIKKMTAPVDIGATISTPAISQPAFAESEESEAKKKWSPVEAVMQEAVKKTEPMLRAWVEETLKANSFKSFAENLETMELPSEFQEQLSRAKLFCGLIGATQVQDEVRE